MRSGAITVRPSGLPGCDLGQELVRRDSGRCGESGASADFVFDAACDLYAKRLAPAVLADVEIRLVQRQRLDEIGDLLE
jgi:hypothetical protein